MIGRNLDSTAQALVANDKGILAIDESNATCNRRFASQGIEQSEEKRRAYRELLITTPHLSDSISGVILYDETIRQQSSDGQPLVKVVENAGMIPGIKVDRGTNLLALHQGERITEGLDGLRKRLSEYREMGARFAKWRAVATIGYDVPSWSGLQANAHALARYAGLCQEAGLVPIVEPEVLMTGPHSLGRCREVTHDFLRAVFIQLDEQRVVLEGLILKPNMILPGEAASDHASEVEVLEATVACLLENVPAAVPGIAFLSGGQSPEEAATHLSAMNARYRDRLPWALTFSFGRALQQFALEAWAGKNENREAAQEALCHQAQCHRAARQGQYSAAMTS